MRFVVDETSLEVGEINEGAVLDFEAFARLLATLRAQEEKIGLLSGWGSTPCGDSDLATALSIGNVPRDLGALVLGLLNQCIQWDNDLQVVVDPVVLVSGEPYSSFGVAFAAARSGTTLTAIAEFPSGRWEGTHQIEFGGQVERELFLKHSERLCDFYRVLLRSDHVGEEEFFALAPLAFPAITFVDRLSFRHFHGGYSIKARVVDHLEILNDHFMEAYASERGSSEQISARIGIPVSIEGETRSSRRLMRMRDVTTGAGTFRCEWHSKIDPHQNRIHFYPADERSGGKIVVGLMVDHLPT